MRNISKDLFDYFESKFDLKTRHVHNALSVYQSNDDFDIVEVDSAGNLDLLLLGPTNIEGYEHSVTGLKTINRMELKENLTVSGTVLGYNMDDVARDFEAGVTEVGGNYKISHLVLNGAGICAFRH